MSYTYQDYEDQELDYENLTPLFGLADVTWYEPKYDFVFTLCDCLDDDCNICGRT